MSKCKHLIDISPYDQLCDHPCMLYGGGAVEAECETCQYRIEDLERENAKLEAENKNLIANYEMLSASYTDSKRVCEHLFTELKRYKSLLRAKLPERELMLIDEIQKLRELLGEAAKMYEFGEVDCGICGRYERCYAGEATDHSPVKCEFLSLVRELGVEVPE